MSLNKDPCSVDWLCVLSHHISMDTPTEVALATGLAVVALAVVLARHDPDGSLWERLYHVLSLYSPETSWPLPRARALWERPRDRVLSLCWELDLFTIVRLYYGIRGAAECCSFFHVCIL